MSRSLDQIPHGANVMVDANIVVYALMPQANLHRPCQTLLERGARGEIWLHTSASVVADVLHRAMVLEVLAQGLVQRSAEAVRLLKQRPDLVVGLIRYRTLLRDLRQAQIDILPLTYRDLHTSRVYREQYGLLVNDSLIVAVMQREHIQFLATNDPDFKRVPGIGVCLPIR
ncbi:MAG: type II toxin-antitoxin system VapC family toxin [Chloroflexaceae bacterium]|nr:type II toxin-antitoxin system VapC family toxin [Chloroflexaceae bacterium]